MRAERSLVLAVRQVVACVMAMTLVAGCGPATPLEMARRPASSTTELNRASPEAPAEAAWGKLPISFVENRGQTHPDVAYHANLGGGTAFFTAGGVTFALRGDHAVPGVDDPVPGQWAVQLSLIDANPQARPVGLEPAEAIFSYLVGPAERHVTGAPTFNGVVYTDAWPGIDLVYGQQDRRLKYSFVVRPGADPNRIVLEIGGATEARVLEDGTLEVATPLGGYRDQAPVAYQEVDGRRVVVQAAFDLEADPESGAFHYGFRLGDYDPSLPLVIDPVVALYVSYLGGASLEAPRAIKVDASGSAYLSGFTSSAGTSFPNGQGFASLSPAVPGFDQTLNGDPDTFIVKLNAAGTALVYATYLGGIGVTSGDALAVDGGGNAYVAGQVTASQASFPNGQGLASLSPAVPGFDQTHNGLLDAYVVKLNPMGTGLVYATYLGGSGEELIASIAVDAAGNAYVTGWTDSTQATFPNGQGFASLSPAVPGFDQSHNGNTDVFIAKLSSNGASLSYATYLGGSSDEPVAFIAVDAAGSAYVLGEAVSTQATFPNGQGFASFSPAVPGFDQSHNGGRDVFVVKLNPSGTGLIYATYLGGSSNELAGRIAADLAGNAIVTGWTPSTQSTFPNGGGFGRVNPVVAGFDQTFNGGTNDVFVVKLNSTGLGLVYATYLGGSDDDRFAHVALDPAGDAYVAGWTISTQATFPNGQGYSSLAQTVSGFDQTHNGGQDGFVVKLNSTGSGLVYGTFLGGSGDETIGDFAVDANGNTYLVGQTNSAQTTFPNGQGFPGLNPPVPSFDQNYNGSRDVFVAKLGPGSPQPTQADVQLVSKVDSPDPVAVGQQLSYTVTVRNNGPAQATGVTVTDSLPSGASFVSVTPSNPTCTHSSGTVTCNLGALNSGATSTVTIVVTPTSAGTLNTTASVTATTSDPTPGNNSAQASTTVQAPNCAQRPRVQVQTQVVSVDGVARLRATISAQSSAQVPGNALTSLEFTAVDDAIVNILPSGPANQTAPFTHTPATGTTQVQLDLSRETAGKAATTRIIAHDACGAWQTLVGAGPAVPI